MKKNIKDYINKGDYAVLCSSEEEWNTIVDLINKNYVSTPTQPYSKTKANILNLQNLNTTIGTGTLKTYPNYTIYPASDFLSTEIIEGQWYKNIGKDDKAYAKCKKFEKNQFYLSDHIGHDKRYRLHTDDSYFSKENYEKAELLTDLSEIQYLLPNNHPDKIKTDIIPEYVKCVSGYGCAEIGIIYNTSKNNEARKLFNLNWKEVLIDYNNLGNQFEISTKEAFDLQNKPKQLTVNNLIESEIYCHIETNNLVKWKNPQPKYYLGNNSTNYNNGFGGNFNNEFTEFRLATSEEKKWLNTCIAQNKFISKNDLHLYDDSGLLIPAQKCEECNDTGKVMKAKLYPSGHTEVWEDCEKCQEKEETMFKQGDYIVNLKREHSQFKINHIFKQKYNLERISPEIDCMGSTCNSWLAIRYINQSDWRYATSEEISEYNRIGKPFDVTTLVKNTKLVKKDCISGKLYVYDERHLAEFPKGRSLDLNTLQKIEEHTWVWNLNIREPTDEEVFKFYKEFPKVSNLMEDILKQAKLKYPIGTKFVPFYGEKLELTVTDDNHIIFEGIKIIVSTNNGNEGYLPNSAAIYGNGKWAKIISLPDEEEWIPKIGEWVWNIKKEYSNVRPNPCQITKIDMANKVWCKDFENESYLNMNEFSKKYRKALPHEIPVLNCLIEKKESFQTAIYDFKDIEIPLIIEKTKQLQTITIESTTDLNLNLTKIKSKQIQTIKI